MAFAYKELTCRTWKLNPVGCYDGPLSCKYSHRDTGVISPPAAITCPAWSQGTCPLHEDECLFAHLDTGLFQDIQKTSYHEPAIVSGRNAGIARAAQRAGFDCSNLNNLIDLVNAVRGAVADSPIPAIRGCDHWEPAYERSLTKTARQASKGIGRIAGAPTGPSSEDRTIRRMNNGVVPNRPECLRYASESSLEAHPERKRVIEGTNTQDRQTSFQSRREQTRPSQGTDYRAPPSSTSSLKIHTERKRMLKDPNFLNPSSTKKLKSESLRSTAADTMIIDLTDESQTPHSSLSVIPNTPAQSEPARIPFSSITNTPHQPSPTKAQQPNNQQPIDHQPNTQADQQALTAQTLHDILTHLHAIEANIDEDRETLKTRWELDANLRAASVTEDLAELNEWFGTVDEGVRGAAGVMRRLVE